jgi:hypothetical protein
MAACEKCWRDSRREDNYAEVMASRKAAPCTAEQQAGPDATECPTCSRRTRHQYARVCMSITCPAYGRTEAA